MPNGPAFPNKPGMRAFGAPTGDASGVTNYPSAGANAPSNYDPDNDPVMKQMEQQAIASTQRALQYQNQNSGN